MSARTVPAWAGDAVTSLGLSVLGVAFTVLSLPIPRGEVGNPGPGFLPLVLGVTLTALGLGAAVRAWRTRAGTGAVSLGNRKALVCVLALGVSAVVLVPLGFLPTMAVFLAVLFRVLGARSWWRSTAVALVSTGALWFFFDRLLGVRLPPGLLPL